MTPEQPKEKKGKEKEGDETAALKKKLEECERAKEEYLAGWQRSRADFLNYKKEEIERIERASGLIKEEMILKILDILDNLSLAKKHISQEAEHSSIKEGIEQIEGQFQKFLREEGVEEVEAEGKEFNPNFHDAAEEVEKEGEPQGKIIEVIQKGYLLNGRLLRPAKVKVVK